MSLPLRLQKKLKEHNFVEHKICYLQNDISFLIKLTANRQSGFGTKHTLKETVRSPFIFFKGSKFIYTLLSLGIFMQKINDNWSRRLAVNVREIHRRNNEPKTETLLPSVKYYRSV